MEARLIHFYKPYIGDWQHHSCTIPISQDNISTCPNILANDELSSDFFGYLAAVMRDLKPKSVWGVTR